MKRGRGTIKKYAIYFVFFILVSVIVSPLVNELLIIGILNYYGCHFTQTQGSDILRGISVVTTPLCELSAQQRVAVSGTGPAANITISFILFLLGMEFRNKKQYRNSSLSSLASIGFIASPILLMLSGEGELHGVFSIIDAEHSLWLLPVLGSILLALAVLYFWSQIEYMRK